MSTLRVCGFDELDDCELNDDGTPNIDFDLDPYDEFDELDSPTNFDEYIMNEDDIQ